MFLRAHTRCTRVKCMNHAHGHACNPALAYHVSRTTPTRLWAMVAPPADGAEKPTLVQLRQGHRTAAAAGRCARAAHAFCLAMCQLAWASAQRQLLPPESQVTSHLTRHKATPHMSQDNATLHNIHVVKCLTLTTLTARLISSVDGRGNL